MSRNPTFTETPATDLEREAANLPPSLLCKRTGLAAGTEDCTCDACLYMAAMETDFLREECPDVATGSDVGLDE